MAWRWHQNRIGVVREKRLRLEFTLLSENRARAIQQPTARAQQGPERLQQLVLGFGKLGDIGFAPQPARVGWRRTMPAAEQGASNKIAS